MFEILTVCTGNICRSPLAELMLRNQLEDLPAKIHSAGTYDLGASRMTSDAQRLAVLGGVSPEEAKEHRSTLLLEPMAKTPDLILTMTRDHRRHVLQLAPARMRFAFTIREFARIAASVPDPEIQRRAAEAGDDPSARLRAAVAVVSSHRGAAPAPRAPEDDDVIDPYRHPWETYQLMASQLTPAVEHVVRTVRLAMDQPGER